ncbi:MAG TPA: hypothetical protein VGD78_14175 [Chthoniobacterales bacterium]
MAEFMGSPPINLIPAWLRCGRLAIDASLGGTSVKAVARPDLSL